MKKLLVVLMLLLWAPSAQAATIFQDAFTDTDGVDLDAHTPDIGTSWTEVALVGSNQLGILSNTLQSETGNSGQGSFWTAQGTYSSADYTVTLTVVDVGSGIGTVSWWIGCRIVNSGGIDGYAAAIADPGNTNDVRIYRLDNGTATKISSTEDVTPADGDIFQLECTGTSIGLKRNAAYVINPITDATYSAAGEAGTGSGEIFGVTEYGTFTGHFDMDNFTVETISGAATFGPLRRRGF